MKERDRQLYYSNKSLARRLLDMYTTKVVQSKVENPMILVFNPPPLLVVFFLSYFDNVSVVCTSKYNFKSSSLYDFVPQSDEDYKGIFEGLYYRAPKVREILDKGQRLQRCNLYLDTEPLKTKVFKFSFKPASESVTKFVADGNAVPVLTLDASLLMTTTNVEPVIRGSFITLKRQGTKGTATYKTQKTKQLVISTKPLVRTVTKHQRVTSFGVPQFDEREEEEYSDLD